MDVLLKDNEMNRVLSMVILITVAAGLLAGCAHSPRSSDQYTLTVQLNTPFNQEFTIVTPVVLNKPFEVTRLNGEIKNTISGVLDQPLDSKYPINLTVSEWASEKSNIKGTTEQNLELDKPCSFCTVFSIAYIRTVTLSKKKL
jgi:hypothetical protein